VRIAESLARFIALLTAQRICAISLGTDKKSNRNFAKLSAWWARALQHASGKTKPNLPYVIPREQSDRGNPA